MGVYGIRMYTDNELRYQFDMHALDFDEMRYSNAHRDYEEEIKTISYSTAYTGWLEINYAYTQSYRWRLDYA